MEYDYSRHYLKWHETTDEHAAAQGRGEYRALKFFIPEDRNCEILDFGCGMGYALTGLKNAGYGNLHGIDSDQAQVKEACRRGLNVRRVSIHETMQVLSDEQGQYDLIICLDVLEHIPPSNLLDVLVALKKCLKKKGRFVCRVPNCNALVATRYRYIDWTHYTSFSEPSLDFVLYHAGFTSIEIYEEPDPCGRISLSTVRWMARRLLRTCRRLAFATEIGVGEAMRLPMSPNIWAVASFD